MPTPHQEFDLLKTVLSPCYEHLVAGGPLGGMLFIK
jgi:hypothetical protein